MKTRLNIDHDRFLIDGKPVFLLGISYYGALGAPDDFIAADLDDMRLYGFNWLRVWATWAAFDNDVSVVTTDGIPREEYLRRLENLVATCDARGIAVDVTLSRGNGVTGPPRLQSGDAHLRAVETVATRLKPYRNWYLDIANERNIEDERFASMVQVRRARDAVKRIDSDRLVTASEAGDISREQVRAYIEEGNIDFLAPHRPRYTETAAKTREKTREYRAWLRDVGKIVPVHYQEPFRRGFDVWDPTREDFGIDLRGARDGGAAGWCLHNGDQRHAPDGRPRRSFDLREQRLFDQLDEEERAFLGTLCSDL